MQNDDIDEAILLARLPNTVDCESAFQAWWRQAMVKSKWDYLCRRAFFAGYEAAVAAAAKR